MIRTIESKIKSRLNSTAPAKHPARELECLNMFIGNWRVEGENHEAVSCTGNHKLMGEESYELHTGKALLVNKWTRTVADTEQTGIGMISFDQEGNHYVVSNLDSLGCERCYKMMVEHKTWKLSSDAERASIEFSNDGNYFKQKWEFLDENLHWKPLCTICGTRIS